MTPSNPTPTPAPAPADPAAMPSSVQIHVPITCASNRLHALHALVAEVEGGGNKLVDALRAEGCPPELIDRVRLLNNSDAWRITRNDCGVFLGLEPARLDAALNRLAMVKENQELLELFIRRGATNVMLGALFSDPPQKIRQLRGMLSPVVASGRPKMPDDRTRDAILADWDALCISVPRGPNAERSRFVVLQQNWPDFLLCSLYAVVKATELDWSEPPRRIPPLPKYKTANATPFAVRRPTAD